MHYYKIKIIKTSGYLNESAGKAPKVLYVESKEALSERQALIRASKKYKGMYGAEIRIADVEQISEGVWDAIKAGAAGLGAVGKAAGNAVANRVKKVGNAVANKANAVKNKYVNARNQSRMNSITKNVLNIINSQFAKEVNSASKFGGFSPEQLQQIQSAIDNVMNAATTAPQNTQPQGPNADEQAGADMTNAAVANASTTGEGEEETV